MLRGYRGGELAKDRSFAFRAVEVFWRLAGGYFECREAQIEQPDVAPLEVGSGVLGKLDS